MINAAPVSNGHHLDAARLAMLLQQTALQARRGQSLVAVAQVPWHCRCNLAALLLRSDSKVPTPQESVQAVTA